MSAFVVVNGWEVPVDDALRYMLLEGRSSGPLAELIDRELLRQHAHARGIVVSDADLQDAVDAMRYERGLQHASRAEAWLRAHHQTLESLAVHVEWLLLRNAVMAAFTDDEVRAHYERHRGDLERVVLFSIRVGTEREAGALRARLDQGEQFPVIAAAASQDVMSRRTGGCVGRLRRGEMSPEIADVVFRAEPGELVGPVRTEKGYNLFLVAGRELPALEEESPEIRLLLFDELMRRLRAEAHVSYPALGE